MQELKLGNIYGFTGGNFDGNVYDLNFLTPTLRSCMSHGSVPRIIKKQLDRYNGKNTLNRTEPNRTEPNRSNSYAILPGLFAKRFSVAPAEEGTHRIQILGLKVFSWFKELRLMQQRLVIV